MHEVSLAAENLTTLFGWLPVTNTLLTAWVVMGVLTIFAIITTWKMKLVPSGLQNFMELVVEFVLETFEGVTANAKLARELFGYIMTLFLFVLFSNWLGLLPGVGSVGFFETVSHGGEEVHKFVPLLRAASSDLSFTLALAALTVIFVQMIGFRHLRLAYLKKFFDFRGPVQFFVGLLEIVSELAKIVSFSFRLFGNVFAGEVLLVVMTFLVPYVVPVPFYGLEVFVGLVQAVVFSVLALVFARGAVDHH